MPEETTHWSNSAGELYDLGWLQCRKCQTWHQVTEELIEAEGRGEPVGVTLSTSDGSTLLAVTNDPSPGEHCPDCGGVLGRWIPANAIGNRPDGTYIMRGDPEDPNKEK
jgi:hypothetical protein